MKKFIASWLIEILITLPWTNKTSIMVDLLINWSEKNGY